MSQSFRQKYFGSKSFYKSVIAITFPVMAQMLIQSLVSLVDNFMVAELGDVKMSGVNVAGQILYLFQVLINAVCTAGGIFMSQFFGAKNEKGMKQSLIFKLILAFISILIYMFCCMVIPYQILSLMVRNNRDAGAILEVGTQYMFIMGFAGIAESEIETLEDGNFIVRVSYPLDEWVYSLILSFGASAKVLEPIEIREEIKKRIADMQKRYDLE